MIKKILVLLVLCISYIDSFYSQDLNGKRYITNEGNFTFNNDSVEFELIGNGCLVFPTKGLGTYEFLDEYLIINAKDYTGKRSDFFTEKSLNDSIIFKVTDDKNVDLPGASIIFYNNKGKVINGVMTNNFGLATTLTNNSIRRIRVSSLGFADLNFEYKQGLNYSIKLISGRIIENKTIVLQVILMDKNDMKLKLLTTDFDNNRNKTKELRYLNRMFK